MTNAMQLEGGQEVFPTAFDRCECPRSIFFHRRSSSLSIQRATRLTWREEEHGAAAMTKRQDFRAFRHMRVEIRRDTGQRLGWGRRHLLQQKGGNKTEKRERLQPLPRGHWIWLQMPGFDLLTTRLETKRGQKACFCRTDI